MTIQREKKEEGFVAITLAVLLVALIGFVALAADVGVLYSARTTAQSVADAAALAGAFTFINNPTAVQPNTAQDHALQVALNNKILGTAVTAADVTVNVDVANRRVTVDVANTQNTYFARVLGVGTAQIATEGIAEAAQYSTGGLCVKPWFIPNTMFGSGGACPACAANQVLVSGGQVTAFAKSQYGQEFILKSQDPHSSIAPGQFYAIQLPGSVGGADYRMNIGTCSDAYLRCGNFYSVETGNLVGPTKQGVQDLIGNPPTDSWTGSIGVYQTPNGLSDTSKNVVVAPIWNSCSMAGFCPAGNFPSGTTVSLQIIGFATFFLEDIQGGNVKARLIGVSSCGAGPAGGAGGGQPDGSTVLTVPLRLVRTS
jgi:putative Flp pilus-assembly TadE/G-like protein